MLGVFEPRAEAGTAYQCLRCGKADYWKKARGLFTCRGCGYEASVLAGTLFQDTHKRAPLMVSGDMVCGEPEKRRQRAGAAKGAGPGQRITPHGNGCISCAAPWFVAWPATGSPADPLKWTRLSLAASCRGRGRGAEGKSFDFHCGGRSKRHRECHWPHSSFRAGKRYRRNARRRPFKRRLNQDSLVKQLQLTMDDATPFGAPRGFPPEERWWLGTHQGAIRAGPPRLIISMSLPSGSTGEPHVRAASCFIAYIEGALQTDPVPAKTLNTQHLDVRQS